MPSREDGCTLREAYLLHQLTPDETDRFEGHLATCAECQRHMTNTARLLGALADLEQPTARPPAHTSVAPPYPPEPASATSHARRWRRGALIGVGGLVAGASITLAVASLHGRGQPAAEVIALTTTRIHGTLVVYRRVCGSSVTVTATGLAFPPPG